MNRTCGFAKNSAGARFSAVGGAAEDGVAEDGVAEDESRKIVKTVVRQNGVDLEAKIVFAGIFAKTKTWPPLFYKGFFSL